MNLQATPHTLTSEELDALLHHPEQANPDLELASLRSVFSDLRTASLAAAEHHHRYASIVPARSHTLRTWSLAMAALILCASAPLAVRHHPAHVSTVAIVATPQPTPAVSDEVLFADVEADLDASVPSPLLPLTADTTTTKSTTQRKR